MSVKPTKVEDFDGISGISSIRGMLANMTNKRAAATLRRHEWKKVAEHYDVLPPGPYIREDLIVDAVRVKLFNMDCPEKAVKSGLRFQDFDESNPLRVAMSVTTKRKYGEWVIKSVDRWIEASDHLFVEFVSTTEDPHIFWTDVIIDGPSRITARAWRKGSDPQDNLEFANRNGPDVLVEIDNSEGWFEEKALTVFEHEWGHVFGIDHLRSPQDKMYARYVGLRDKDPLGPGDIEEITKRHGESETVVEESEPENPPENEDDSFLI